MARWWTKAWHKMTGRVKEHQLQKTAEAVESSPDGHNRNGNPHRELDVASPEAKIMEGQHASTAVSEETSNSSAQESAATSTSPVEDFQHQDDSGRDADKTLPPSKDVFWDRAVDALREDEKTLLLDYVNVIRKSCLADFTAPCEGGSVGSTVYRDIENINGLSEDDIGMLKDRDKMTSVARHKISVMKKKELHFKVGDRDMGSVRDKFDKIIAVVQRVSPIITQGLSYAPSPASGAWAGVGLIMSLITSDTQQRAEVIGAVSDLAFMLERYLLMEKNYWLYIEPHAKFEEAMLKVHYELVLFYAKAARCFSRNTFLITLRNTIQLDDWIAAVQSVKQADEICRELERVLITSAIKSDTSTILSDTLALRELTGSEHDEHHLEKVITWAGEVNVSEEHRAAKSRLGRYVKSGQWFLSGTEFSKLKQGSTRCLWLRGAVGTGKSSIAYVAIEDLQRANIDVAFYYCSPDMWKESSDMRKESSDMRKEKAKTPLHEDILRSLAAQLGLSPDGKHVTRELEKAYSKSRTVGGAKVPLDGEGAEDLFPKLMKSRRRAVIVIDALDEMPQHSKLLKSIARLISATSNLYFLLTSQLSVDIATCVPQHVPLVIAAEDTGADMVAFIDGQIAEYLADHPDLSNQVVDDIRKTLISNANGMFKWTELCLAYIMDIAFQPGVVQQSWEEIKQWQETEDRPWQGDTAGLIAMYNLNFERDMVQHPNQNEYEEIIARLCKWIFVSTRPLTKAEVQVLCFPYGLPKPCRTLFMQSESGSIVVTHSSARDFLAARITSDVDTLRRSLSEAGSIAKRYNVLDSAHRKAQAEANAFVALDCLRRIQGCTELSDAQDCSGTFPPLIEYARRSWTTHFERSGSEDDESSTSRSEVLQESLYVFFSGQSRLDQWLFHEDDDPDFGLGSVIQSAQDLAPTRGTNLYYAIILGHKKIASKLIEQGANINTAGGLLGHPLQISSYLGYFDLTSKLISHGARINAVAGIFGTALTAAIFRGHFDIADMLLVKGADPAIAGKLSINSTQVALCRPPLGPIVQALSRRIELRDNPVDKIWRQVLDASSTYELSEAFAKVASRLETIPQYLVGILGSSHLGDQCMLIHQLMLPEHRLLFLVANTPNRVETIMRSTGPGELLKNKRWVSIIEGIMRQSRITTHVGLFYRLEDSDLTSVHAGLAKCVIRHLIIACSKGLYGKHPKHFMQWLDCVCRMLFAIHTTLLRLRQGRLGDDDSWGELEGRDSGESEYRVLARPVLAEILADLHEQVVSLAQPSTLHAEPGELDWLLSKEVELKKAESRLLSKQSQPQYVWARNPGFGN